MTNKDKIINTLNTQIQKISIELATLKELVKILSDNLK